MAQEKFDIVEYNNGIYFKSDIKTDISLNLRSENYISAELYFDKIYNLEIIKAFSSMAQVVIQLKAGRLPLDTFMDFSGCDIESDAAYIDGDREEVLNLIIPFDRINLR